MHYCLSSLSFSRLTNLLLLSFVVVMMIVSIWKTTWWLLSTGRMEKWSWQTADLLTYWSESFQPSPALPWAKLDSYDKSNFSGYEMTYLKLSMRMSKFRSNTGTSNWNSLGRNSCNWQLWIGISEYAMRTSPGDGGKFHLCARSIYSRRIVREICFSAVCW